MGTSKSFRFTAGNQLIWIFVVSLGSKGGFLTAVCLRGSRPVTGRHLLVLPTKVSPT